MKDVRRERCQNGNVSGGKGVKRERCQNGNVSEWKCVRMERCQNGKSEWKGVRMERCQNGKVSGGKGVRLKQSFEKYENVKARQWIWNGKASGLKGKYVMI